MQGRRRGEVLEENSDRRRAPALLIQKREGDGGLTQDQIDEVVAGSVIRPR